MLEARRLMAARRTWRRRERRATRRFNKFVTRTMLELLMKALPAPTLNRRYDDCFVVADKGVRLAPRWATSQPPSFS